MSKYVAYPHLLNLNGNPRMNVCILRICCQYVRGQVTRVDHRNLRKSAVQASSASLFDAGFSQLGLRQPEEPGRHTEKS